MDWVDAYDDLGRVEFADEAGRRHIYEWINEVPLNGKEDVIQVNFFRCVVLKTDKSGSVLLLPLGSIISLFCW